MPITSLYIKLGIIKTCLQSTYYCFCFTDENIETTSKLRALCNIIQLVSVRAGIPTYFTSCPTSLLFSGEAHTTHSNLDIMGAGWEHGKGRMPFSAPKTGHLSDL